MLLQKLKAKRPKSIDQVSPEKTLNQLSTLYRSFIARRESVGVVFLKITTDKLSLMLGTLWRKRERYFHFVSNFIWYWHLKSIKFTTSVAAFSNQRIDSSVSSHLISFDDSWKIYQSLFLGGGHFKWRIPARSVFLRKAQHFETPYFFRGKFWDRLFFPL